MLEVSERTNTPVDKRCISQDNNTLLHSSGFSLETAIQDSEMWKSRQFPTGLSATMKTATLCPALSTEPRNYRG